MSSLNLSRKSSATLGGNTVPSSSELSIMNDSTKTLGSQNTPDESSLHLPNRKTETIVLNYITGSSDVLDRLAKFTGEREIGPSTISEIDGYLIIGEITEPSGTPASGYGYLYIDSSDSKIKFKDDSGIVYDLTTGTGGSTSSPFQNITFANPLNITASIYKDWMCPSITNDTIINLNSTSNGDSGMIKFTMDSTGGYSVTLGTMFTERLGSTGLDVTANAINYVSWRNVGGNITYTVDIATAV